jgi:hypothetical protein
MAKVARCDCKAFGIRPDIAPRALQRRVLAGIARSAARRLLPG